MSHLLVTNDFPPKVGGIQTYLWELWRRLPPGRATVVAPSYPGDAAFDAAQPFPVRRLPQRVLLPTPGLVRQVRAAARESGAALVVLDPALPLGLVGAHLGLPYVVVVHGAEVSVPGRLPATSAAIGSVLRGAVGVVAGGDYVAREAHRAAGAPLDVTIVPPGVDGERFRPLGADERAKARADLGVAPDAALVVAVSRLVPRKGVDAVIGAAALLAPRHPELTVAVAGHGRDLPRLRRLAARSQAPVRFLGRLPDEVLPALYGCADVFAVPCRSRWGGLEQEGFGIVFLEAAACGVPQVAGDSGGAAEAVAHGRTGLVVARPRDPRSVAAALGHLLDDADLRAAMGRAARDRARRDFSYDALAARLDAALAAHGG